MDLAKLTPEQRRILAGAVEEQLIKVSHPDRADEWDIWWRVDYERFVAAHPEAEPELVVRSASVEEAAPFMDVLDPDAPTFALWSKGLIRNRYERSEHPPGTSAGG